MSELDPRIASAAEHVQRAALELIAAMRDALDLAEDLFVKVNERPVGREPVQRIRLDD